MIRGEATSLIAAQQSSPPYVAPEVSDGEAPSPQSDQFGLAAITYEWLFGRPIDRPATRPVEVRTMPGVDRAALSKAFTRALLPTPSDRFRSCSEFCEAVAGSVVPELPLLALESGAEVPHPTAAAEVVHAPASVHEWPRFGGTALIFAAIIGSIFGFAAGYMARPRALQTLPPQTMATLPAAEHDVPKAQPSVAAPAEVTVAEAPKAAPRPAPHPKRAVVANGTMIVESRPTGASVAVNGTPRGNTPLTIHDLAPGEYRVLMSKAGYRNVVTTVRVVAGQRVRAAASLTALEQE